MTRIVTLAFQADEAVDPRGRSSPTRGGVVNRLDVDHGRVDNSLHESCDDMPADAPRMPDRRPQLDPQSMPHFFGDIRSPEQPMRALRAIADIGNADHALTARKAAALVVPVINYRKLDASQKPVDNRQHGKRIHNNGRKPAIVVDTASIPVILTVPGRPHAV